MVTLEERSRLIESGDGFNAPSRSAAPLHRAVGIGGDAAITQPDGVGAGRGARPRIDREDVGAAGVGDDINLLSTLTPDLRLEIGDHAAVRTPSLHDDIDPALFDHHGHEFVLREAELVQMLLPAAQLTLD
jgi:hypothetical protein